MQGRIPEHPAVWFDVQPQLSKCLSAATMKESADGRVRSKAIIDASNITSQSCLRLITRLSPGRCRVGACFDTQTNRLLNVGRPSLAKRSSGKHSLVFAGPRTSFWDFARRKHPDARTDMRSGSLVRVPPPQPGTGAVRKRVSSSMPVAPVIPLPYRARY